MKWFHCTVLVDVYASTIPDPAERTRISALAFDYLYEHGVEAIMVGDGSDDEGYLDFTFRMRAHTREGAEQLSAAYIQDALNATQWEFAFNEPRSNAVLTGEEKT
jgi:hypothetical protein